MNELAERLRAFAAGCRGSMWQSRDKTVSLCDEAADEITALRARLEAVEKERDGWQTTAQKSYDGAVEQFARAERAEAALATARRDALEEAAMEANYEAQDADDPMWQAASEAIEDRIRALADEAET